MKPKRDARLQLGVKFVLLTVSLVCLTSAACWLTHDQDWLVRGGVKLACLGLAVAISLWLARDTEGELDKIIRGAERLAAGEPLGSLGVTSKDRIGVLADKFEWMADELSKEKGRLRDSLTRHQAVLEMAADGFITAREAGDIRSFNQAAEGVFGFGAEEVVSEEPETNACRLWQLIPVVPTGTTDRDKLQALLAEFGLTEPGKRSAAREMTGRRKDGSEFPMEVAISLAVANDRPIVTAIARDITERKRQEEEKAHHAEVLEKEVQERTVQLRQAMDAQDRFMANLSHDLRTPLSIVLGYCDTLRKSVEARLYEDVPGDIDVIVRAAQRLEGLIGDLLSYYKLSSDGRLELNPEKFDLVAEIRSWQAEVEYLARKDDNSYQTLLPDRFPVDGLDKTLFKRVLLNLLSNACKFTQKGKVSLEASRASSADKEGVVLHISDTGRGIPKEQLANLFSRYRPGATPTANEGFGLGLSICRLYVDLMGGWIDVESVVGQGSTFTVWLPCLVSEATASSEAISQLPPPAPRTGPQRVLIIEDDTDLRKLWTNELTDVGFAPIAVENGVEGIKAATKPSEMPDVIVLDVMMHGLDGWGVLAALKANSQTSRIPIIMATILDDRKRGYTLGADDYIVKPFTTEKLTALIAKHLRKETEKLTALLVSSKADVLGDALDRTTLHLPNVNLFVDRVTDATTALDRIEANRPDLILLDLRSPGINGKLIEELTRRKIPLVVIADFEDEASDRWEYWGQVAACLNAHDVEDEDELGKHIQATIGLVRQGRLAARPPVASAAGGK